MAAAAVAVTSPSACSDGPGTSKEDFVAAADDLCREADERIAAAGRVEKGILEYVEQAREISADLVADLRALEPPEADEGEVEQMVDDLERATDLLAPLAQATEDRDADEVRDLQEEVRQVTDEISSFADSYGFEVCGAQVLEPAR